MSDRTDNWRFPPKRKFPFPPVLPKTQEACADILKALMARNGRMMPLDFFEAGEWGPALVECFWPSLARALGAAGPSLRCLVMPWDAAGGWPAERRVSDALARSPSPPDAILLATSSLFDFDKVAEVAEQAGAHLAAADALSQRMLEAGLRLAPLADLFGEARMAPPPKFGAVGGVRMPFPADSAAASQRSRADRMAGGDAPGGAPGSWQAATPATAFAIAACLLVFVLMVLSGVSPSAPSGAALVRWGANGGFLVAQGQWWRPLTAAFVHVGFLHLFFNLYCLWHLGRVVERLFGSAAFAAVYVLTAFGAGLASIAWRPTGLSAGASGAVFGICGALVGFMAVRRHVFPRHVLQPLWRNMAVFLGLNLAFGFIVPSIDNAAHIGGLACGVLCGLLLSPQPFPATHRRSGARRWARAGGLALALVAAAVWVHAAILTSVDIARPMFIVSVSEDMAAIDRENWSFLSLAVQILQRGRPEEREREAAARSRERLEAIRRRVQAAPDAEPKPAVLELVVSLEEAYAYVERMPPRPSRDELSAMMEKGKALQELFRRAAAQLRE